MLIFLQCTHAACVSIFISLLFPSISFSSPLRSTSDSPHLSLILTFLLISPSLSSSLYFSHLSTGLRKDNSHTLSGALEITRNSIVTQGKKYVHKETLTLTLLSAFYTLYHAISLTEMFSSLFSSLLPFVYPLRTSSSLLYLLPTQNLHSIHHCDNTQGDDLYPV
jgi:hypothetical protein